MDVAVGSHGVGEMCHANRRTLIKKLALNPNQAVPLFRRNSLHASANASSSLTMMFLSRVVVDMMTFDSNALDAASRSSR